MKLLVAATLALAIAAGASISSQSKPAAAFSVVEKTIPEMQRAMREGRVTSRQLVEQYLRWTNKKNE